MVKQTQQHILERRSHLLAQRIQQRISDLSLFLQAAGGRIPYRTKLSKGSALDWWSKHRYDSLGQQALAGLDPLTVAKLDNALNDYQRNQSSGLPVETAPPQGGSLQDTISAAASQMQPGGQNGSSTP